MSYGADNKLSLILTLFNIKILKNNHTFCALFENLHNILELQIITCKFNVRLSY